MNIEHMTLDELIKYGDLPAKVVQILENIKDAEALVAKENAATDHRIDLLEEQLYFARSTINEFEAILKLGDTPSAKIKLLRAELGACSLER